jgi:hypothetical protein
MKSWFGPTRLQRRRRRVRKVLIWWWCRSCPRRTIVSSAFHPGPCFCASWITIAIHLRNLVYKTMYTIMPCFCNSCKYNSSISYIPQHCLRIIIIIIIIIITSIIDITIIIRKLAKGLGFRVFGFRLFQGLG